MGKQDNMYKERRGDYSEQYIEAPEDEISITFLCIPILRSADQ